MIEELVVKIIVDDISGIINLKLQWIGTVLLRSEFCTEHQESSEHKLDKLILVNINSINFVIYSKIARNRIESR